MKYNVALPEELKRQSELNDREAEVRRIKIARRTIRTAFLAPGGFLGASFMSGKEKKNWLQAGLFGLVVIGLMIIKNTLVDKLTFKRRRDAVGTSIHKTMLSAQDDYKALRLSYDSIFSSFVDGFSTERAIYEEVYNIKTLEKKREGLLETKDSIESEIATQNKILKKTEDKIFELDKESPEDNVSNVDLPAFSSTRQRSERVVLADRLNETRENLNKLSSELKSIMSDIQSTNTDLKSYKTKFARHKLSYSRCIANRKARSMFLKYFVNGMMTVYDDLVAISKMPPKDINGVIYLERELKKIKDFKLNIEKNYNEFCEDVNGHMEAMLSPTSKLKRGRKTDMTYDSAPFWKVFQTFVNPDIILMSDSYEESLNEIIEGATEDADNPLAEEGRWLTVKNYSETWLYNVGDFTEEQAVQLSEYLAKELDGEMITVRTELSTINKAYKTFVKRFHSDATDDVSGDLIIAEVSTLVKAFRKYQERYVEIFNDGGEIDGTTSETEI